MKTLVEDTKENYQNVTNYQSRRLFKLNNTFLSQMLNFKFKDISFCVVGNDYLSCSGSDDHIKY